MKYKLRITLLSEMMPGNGIGFGAYVNNDICFDELGIPYIPAKRVKGCLREGADTLTNMGIDTFKDDLPRMFGDVNDQGTLQFENLLIQGSVAIRAGLQAQQSVNDAAGSANIGSWITAENVVACFTALRAQTAINDDGYAKDNSLRVSRVLKRGLVFEGAVYCPRCHLEALRLCAKAARFMGTQRTRGLGEVKIEVQEITDSSDVFKPKQHDAVKNKKAEKAVLRVALMLQSPVIVADLYAGDTQPYLPGSALRGCVCNAYIQSVNKDHPQQSFLNAGRQDFSDDPEFARLFLKGGLQFTYGTITDKAMQRYDPIPSSIKQIKLRSGCDAMEPIDLRIQETDEKTTTCKQRYIRFIQDSASNYQWLPVKERISYHHSTRDDSFFTYCALAEGQRFLFEILGARDDVTLIAKVLQAFPSFSIGRSRTAEYGAAYVEHLLIQDADVEMTIPTDRFTAVLASPCCLMDKWGMSTADAGDLMRSIERNLLATYDISTSLTLEKPFINSRVMGGYNPMWQLAKSMVPALDMGSTVTFHSDRPLQLPTRLWIGGRRNEGMGEVHIGSQSDLTAPVHFQDAQKEHTDDALPDDPAWTAVYQQILEMEAIRQLEAYAHENPLSSGMNMTTVNSLLNFLDRCDTLDAFVSQVHDLKTETKKNVICQALFGLKAHDTIKLSLPELKERVQAQLHARTSTCKAVSAGAFDVWFVAKTLWRRQLELNRLSLRNERGLEHADNQQTN